MALIKFTGCDACSLKEDWPHLHTPKMQMARPTQESQYRVLLLGEAPGAEEDKEGRPFVGKSGKLLRTYIPHDWEKKVYWQNTVRCRPTDKDANRAPTPREVKCCSTYLREDLAALRPQCILGIGREALTYFWPGAEISKLRGIPFPVFLPDGTPTWFVSSFHPSYVMRGQRQFDGVTTNAILPVFKHDLADFFANVPKFATPPKIAIPPTNKVFPKTKEHAIQLFNSLKEPYAIDFESMKLKPWMRDSRLLCTGCSDGDTTFAFPVNWPGDPNPWGIQVLLYMMQSRKRWIAQHATMELAWILDATKVYNLPFHDLEVVVRLLHKRKGVGSLDVISRIYAGLDIKQLTNRSLASKMLGPLDKTRIAEYSQEQILDYCSDDAWSEAFLFYQLFPFLPESQYGNYERTLSTLESITAMELAGLDVSKEESEKLQTELFSSAVEIEKEARQLPEVKEFESREQRLFSIGSPQVVARVLSAYCHVKLSEDPETHNLSTDSSVLEPLIGTNRLIDLTLDYREVEKQRGTYVEPILQGKVLGADYRLHSSYTAIHTATYRLSSEFPNIQNFPKRKHKEIRRQVVPRKGFVFAAFDYGQLEARTLVMASKDPVLKKSFINHEDIHSKWLNRLLELFPPYLSRLALATGQTDPDKIREAGRDTIKTDFVFACFYGSVAKSVADRAMIPMDIAIKILREFWGEYMYVRQWIDGQFEYYNRTGTVQSLTQRIRDEVLPGNEVINSPIQGTAAEIVLEAQNALFKLATTEDMNLLPRINIHDDLIFELPDDNDLERYIRLIGQEIVKPRFPFVNLPLMTECRIGYNWCDLAKITKIEGPWFENGVLVYPQ